MTLQLLLTILSLSPQVNKGVPFVSLDDATDMPIKDHKVIG
ncbi:hypothetical protein [Mannheimia haemolytica]